MPSAPTILFAAALLGGCVVGNEETPPFALTDLDQSCLDGGTGRQAVAVVHGPYTATFTRYGASTDGGTADVPPPTPLTIGLAYDGGAIECVPQHLGCDPAGPFTDCSNGPHIPPVVRVDMEITLRSADGALDEQFAAPVDWTSSEPDGLAWQAEMPATSIHGTYVPMLANAAATTLRFSGRIRSGVATGSLSEVTPQESSGGGTW